MELAKGVNSGHIKMWFRLAWTASQNLAVLLKHGAVVSFVGLTPSMNLSFWYSFMATECNLLLSSVLLPSSFLAHIRNKRVCGCVWAKLYLLAGNLKTWIALQGTQTHDQKACDNRSNPERVLERSATLFSVIVYSTSWDQQDFPFIQFWSSVSYSFTDLNITSSLAKDKKAPNP